MLQSGLILKLACPDRPGIVARIASHVAAVSGNLLEFSQFTDLDAGPIIEQTVERVQHYHSVADLIRLGRDCERSALARGIRWHVHDRTIIDGHRAIVFPD